MSARRARLPWVLGVLMGLLVGGLPSAASTSHEAVQELNARSLNVLLYHPYPDPEGDTWGFPDPAANGTRGYFESAYGSGDYPLAVVDGADHHEGAVGFENAFAVYEESFLRRLEKDSPLRLVLIRSPNETASEARLTVRLSAKAPLATAALALRVALFEDEVPHVNSYGETSGSVVLHRFAVRATATEETVEILEGSETTREVRFALNSTLAMERLGVVASVHNRDPASPEFQPHEVLQSATYKFGQPGPTIQVRRGVLLEMLSATWCPACLYGDGAVNELANQYGLASSEFLSRGRQYLRDIDEPVLLSAVVAGLALGGASWFIDRRGQKP